MTHQSDSASGQRTLVLRSPAVMCCGDLVEPGTRSRTRGKPVKRRDGLFASQLHPDFLSSGLFWLLLQPCPGHVLGRRVQRRRSRVTDGWCDGGEGRCAA